MRTLLGRSILVVEDEPLVCLDITRCLQDAGATVFAASHLDKALGLAGRSDLSAGVLDFDLNRADSTLICLEAVRPPHPICLPHRPSLQRLPSVARSAGDLETGEPGPDCHRCRGVSLDELI